MWLINIGFILQGLKDEFSSSVSESGIIISFYPFGILVGSIIFGVISDRYGRKYSFKNSVLFVSISSTLLLVSINQYMVAACLFLVGIGIGGETSLVSTVFFEFCPPSKRYLMALLSLS